MVPCKNILGNQVPDEIKVLARRSNSPQTVCMMSQTDIFHKIILDLLNDNSNRIVTIMEITHHITFHLKYDVSELDPVYVFR
jgi:hypothetical protein